MFELTLIPRVYVMICHKKNIRAKNKKNKNFSFDGGTASKIYQVPKILPSVNIITNISSVYAQESTLTKLPPMITKSD